MRSPSRNVQYHPPRLSEDRLNLPQPHSPSLAYTLLREIGNAPPAKRVDGRDRPCVVNALRAKRGPYPAAPRAAVSTHRHLFQESPIESLRPPRNA